MFSPAEPRQSRLQLGLVRDKVPYNTVGHFRMPWSLQISPTMKLVRELSIVNATFQYPIMQASTTPTFSATFCLTIIFSVSRAAFWRSLNLELFRSPRGALACSSSIWACFFLISLSCKRLGSQPQKSYSLEVWCTLSICCNHVTIHSWKFKQEFLLSNFSIKGFQLFN